MKAVIKSVEYVKEYETKFGNLHLHRIKYNEKTAYYSSKKKDQTYFVKGKEVEFTEEEQKNDKGTFYKVKPIRQNSYSGYAKAVKKEQSKYSGFAMSYAKDLCVAGKIELRQLSEYTKKMFTLMVELDKTLENDNS